MDTLAEQLHELRRRLVDTARALAGARTLAEAIYGVGPMTSLALCSWLGGAERFQLLPQGGPVRRGWMCVRSPDSKRSPGRLSRQGPEVLGWLLFEAAKASARTRAPGHGYYAQVRTVSTATGPRCPRPAGSYARPYTSSPILARMPSHSCLPDRHRSPDEVHGGCGHGNGSSTDGVHRGLLLARTCQAMPMCRTYPARHGRPN
jgi:hypothetical protein